MGIDDLVLNLQLTVLGILGSIAIISWVIVAILFLTAAGNPGRLGTAKSAAIWAFVGTAIAILASSAVAIVNNALGI